MTDDTEAERREADAQFRAELIAAGVIVPGEYRLPILILPPDTPALRLDDRARRALHRPHVEHNFVERDDRERRRRLPTLAQPSRRRVA